MGYVARLARSEKISKGSGDKGPGGVDSGGGHSCSLLSGFPPSPTQGTREALLVDKFPLAPSFVHHVLFSTHAACLGLVYA